MSATVPSQDGNQHLSSEHTKQKMDMTVHFHKGYHHQDPEYTLSWMGVTVPYMKGDKQHNNECPELDIAVKTAQTDLQLSAGPDTLPAGYIKFLSEEKLYKNTWQHRNAFSGLDLYEMFLRCLMKMKQCICSDRSPTWHPVFRPHKYPPLFLCVPCVSLANAPKFFFFLFLGGVLK
jgi:hypothetical protein